MSLNRKAIANQGISFSALLKALQGLTGEAETPASSDGSAAQKVIYGRFASQRYLIDFLAEKQKCKAQDLIFKKMVMMLREKKELERHMLGDLAEYKQVMQEYASERKRLDTDKIEERADKLKSQA